MKLRHRLLLTAFLVVGLAQPTCAQQRPRKAPKTFMETLGLRPPVGVNVRLGAPPVVSPRRPVVATMPSIAPMRGSVVRPSAPTVLGVPRTGGIGISGTGMVRPGTGSGAIGGAASVGARISGTGLRPKH